VKIDVITGKNYLNESQTRDNVTLRTEMKTKRYVKLHFISHEHQFLEIVQGRHTIIILTALFNERVN